HAYKLNLDGNKLDLKLRMQAYQVKLEEGTKYVMTADAGDEIFDPLLVVLDGAGNILAYDDDSGGKLNSKLFFTPKRSGAYGIHVAGIRDTVGPYTLKISEAITNVVKLGFPAGKCDSQDLSKSDTAWEIEWEITNPENGMSKKNSSPSSVLAIRSARFMFKDKEGKFRWYTVLKNLEVG